MWFSIFLTINTFVLGCNCKLASPTCLTSSYDLLFVKEDMMSNLIIDAIGAVCAVILVWCLVRGYSRSLKPNKQDDSISIENYLQKITHITGFSSYEIFRRSAEDWNVPADRIERDFKMYLSSLTIPYYVKDFVRRGQKHIDELYLGKGGSFTDKRLLAFYAFLVLLLWGGAFFLSLYVFPHILPGDIRSIYNVGPP